eukprot:CAMPEP_0184501924 /NCGR_PEP_ID=MMETSP0113_2-20130426/48951_1 /TAXON_ID=91329 /ORGANISM="Norrisiella sphaerica, Strain BC52" /LENGTH=95 /DNA_ID=CAMNT_0026890867 /DNA_START=34 /DNA_END=321 /DNA_ORIENTATION=-
MASAATAMPSDTKKPRARPLKGKDRIVAERKTAQAAKGLAKKAARGAAPAKVAPKPKVAPKSKAQPKTQPTKKVGASAPKKKAGAAKPAKAGGKK